MADRDLSEAELLMAAKGRAWEVIRRWRDVPACDDETLAAMVAKVVLGEADSAADAMPTAQGRSDG